MKIALISIPMPTFNNRGAASALPYHLIKGAGKDARFEVWTYNSNHIPPSDVAETERALGVKIHILRQPWWMAWMFRLHVAVLRMLLRYPYLRYLRLDAKVRAAIRAFAPDKLWIYGEEIAHFADIFPDVPAVATITACLARTSPRGLCLRYCATPGLSGSIEAWSAPCATAVPCSISWADKTPRFSGRYAQRPTPCSSLILYTPIATRPLASTNQRCGCSSPGATTFTAVVAAIGSYWPC